MIVLMLIIGGGYLLLNRDSSEGGEVTVIPISHASLALAWGGELLFSDPVGDIALYAETGAPSIILVTDIHGDHLNVETLEGLITPNTVVIAPQAVADNFTETLLNQTVILGNTETTEQKGFSIEAIPMYNLPDQGVEIRHEKGRGNGYLIERGGMRVYIAGDTADIPEMRALTNIDIAFVPMNLPYTMDIQRAANAVLDFAPKKVYPYHYRGQDGLADVEAFKNLVITGNSNIEVILADWYPETPQSDNEEEEGVVFEISGKNFEYDITEIRVSEGDTVTINFTSESGFHDWVVDEFKANTERVRDGGATSVTFVADKKGTFEYYCSVGEHRAQGMVGTLIVE